MLRNLIEYHWAEHLDDVLPLLARLDVKTVPLAGGTSVLALDDDSVEAVVDLRDLELASILEDARGVHIGAMATLQHIASHPLLNAFASGIVSHAAYASVPSTTLRNSATIGGTLVLGASSHADLLPVLAALEAEAVMRSGSRTAINLNDGMLERPGLALSGIVYKGRHERRLACLSVKRERLPSELLVDVVISHAASTMRGAFVRVSETPTSIALLNMALVLEMEQERLRHVRVVYGGGEMEPMHCTGIEQLLEGQRIQDIQNESHLLELVQKGLTTFRPTTDRYASGGYRRVIAVQLVRQAFSEIFAHSENAQMSVERAY